MKELAEVSSPVRFTIDVDNERLAGVYFGCEAPRAQLLLLHGAGDADKGRMLGMARAAAAERVIAYCIDFSGHGDSSGDQAELTLERRARQARGALSHIIQASLPTVIGGFSMGGQTACDLLDVPEVAGIVLFCPAAYAFEVRSMRFDDPDFPLMLHGGDSWRTSPSFSALRHFRGPVQFVMPEKDDVIPPEVTRALVSTRTGRDESPIVIPGADHSLGKWFLEHPDSASVVARRIIEMMTSDSDAERDAM